MGAADNFLGLDFKVTGLAEISRAIKRTIHELPSEIDTAMRGELEFIKKRIIANTPEDTGATKASIGYHLHTDNMTGHVTAYVYADSGTSPWAFFVHEGINQPRVNLTPTPEGWVGWKFIERVMTHYAGHMQRELAISIDRMLDTVWNDPKYGLK